MHLNNFGEIANQCWENIPEHFSNIELDLFVIMPNHMHGIVVWSQIAQSTTNVGERHASPLHKNPSYHVKSGSVISMIGSYKSAVTRRVNQKRNSKIPAVWQRSFHDRIIRNETELTKLREYVLYNPSLWAEDKYHNDA